MLTLHVWAFCSFNVKQIMAPSRNSNHQNFVVPPPPSKIVASNMSKPLYNGFDDLRTAQLSSAGRQRNPIMLFNCEEALSHDMHPSPSESPDSQKVDSHHENSDSGLGTDHHEYYK